MTTEISAFDLQDEIDLDFRVRGEVRELRVSGNGWLTGFYPLDGSANGIQKSVELAADVKIDSSNDFSLLIQYLHTRYLRYGRNSAGREYPLKESEAND